MGFCLTRNYGASDIEASSATETQNSASHTLPRSRQLVTPVGGAAELAALHPPGIRPSPSFHTPLTPFYGLFISRG